MDMEKPWTSMVIDTDPGIDDALALILACASLEPSVEAITPVAGDVPATRAARGAAVPVLATWQGRVRDVPGDAVVASVGPPPCESGRSCSTEGVAPSHRTDPGIGTEPSGDVAGVLSPT